MSSKVWACAQIADRSWVSTLTGLCWLLGNGNEKAHQWERVMWLMKNVHCEHRKGVAAWKRGVCHLWAHVLTSLGISYITYKTRLRKPYLSDGRRLAKMGLFNVLWGHFLSLGAYIPAHFMHIVPLCSHENSLVCVGWGSRRELSRLSDWKLLLKGAETLTGRMNHLLALKCANHRRPTNQVWAEYPPWSVNPRPVFLSLAWCVGEHESSDTCASSFQWWFGEYRAMSSS